MSFNENQIIDQKKNQKQLTTPADWILYRKIDPKPIRFNNQHLLLNSYFSRILGFPPKKTYYDSLGIIFFVSRRPFKIIMRKYIKEIEYLRKKFSKMVYIVEYTETMLGLVESLFSHVEIKKIWCLIRPNDKNRSHNILPKNELAEFNPSLVKKGKYKVSIFVKINDPQMPFALGKKGSYIHLINNLLSDWFGNYAIFMRS